MARRIRRRSFRGRPTRRRTNTYGRRRTSRVRGRRSTSRRRSSSARRIPIGYRL